MWMWMINLKIFQILKIAGNFGIKRKFLIYLFYHFFTDGFMSVASPPIREQVTCCVRLSHTTHTHTITLQSSQFVPINPLSGHTFVALCVV